MSHHLECRTRMILQLLMLMLAVACPWHAANSATFSVLSDTASMQPERLNMTASLTLIRLTGPIREGDSDDLREILTPLRGASRVRPGVPLAAIELSSNGGDVYEGLNIGYLLREFAVASIVRKGDQCLSACALAFLGGTASNLPPKIIPDRRIEIGGEVAFHNFSINPYSAKLPSTPDTVAGMIVGFDLARGGSALLVRYAAVMALDPLLIARLLGRPPEMWDYIDRDGQFVDYASCPLAVERPAQSDAEVATNICNHATGGVGPVEQSKARPVSERDARRWLLGFVQKNVAGMSLKGPLVSQLNNALAGRDDRSMEALYDELRKAGIRLPDLIGKTFEVDGYAIGSYELQCHVSMSSTDPDRYEVAISGPAGLSRAYKDAPDKCKRLFLFDRGEMLNPPM